MTISAGILLYRMHQKDVQFLLVHPGGPFFKNKNKGWWTIPKGEPEEGEALLTTAIREMAEETGITVTAPEPLGHIKQKGGKVVHAWACRGDWNPDQGLPTNLFEMEWPPKSGIRKAFPEIDQARWFDYQSAKDHINEAQIPLLNRALKASR